MKYERTAMTSFLTHEGGIAAGLTVNFAQKTAEAASRPVRAVMAPRAFLRGQALLGPLRQLMRRIDRSGRCLGLMTYIRYQP